MCLSTRTVRSSQLSGGSAYYGTCSEACTRTAKQVLVPPATRAAIRKLDCDRCGKTFLTNQPAHRLCSNKCSKKDAKLRRRAREAGTYGQWRWSDFMRIARKFGYQCAYCGTKPERLDPDHVVALSAGGSNTISNLLPSCPSCNADKQAYSLQQWTTSRHARGLPPRTTSWAPEDPRYVHLTEPGIRSVAA